MLCLRFCVCMRARGRSVDPHPGGSFIILTPGTPNPFFSRLLPFGLSFLTYFSLTPGLTGFLLINRVFLVFVKVQGSCIFLVSAPPLPAAYYTYLHHHRSRSLGQCVLLVTSLMRTFKTRRLSYVPPLVVLTYYLIPRHEILSMGQHERKHARTCCT